MEDKLVQTGKNLEGTYGGSRKPGGTTLNSVHWLLVGAGDLNILAVSTYYKETAEVLLFAGNEMSLDEHADKTMHM